MLTCAYSPLARALLRQVTPITCRNFNLGLPTLLQSSKVVKEGEEISKTHLSHRDFRYVFPEFLPDPNPSWRNAVRERLERKDMLQRREKLEIPGNPVENNILAQ